MHASDQLIQFAEKHLARLAKHLHAVRASGDVDAVHDFRVASRRLQEPLEVIARCPALAGAKPVRRIPAIQRRLKRVRRTLSPVRDLDVLTLSLGDGPAAPGLTDRQFAQLTQLLADARADALEHGCRKLDRRKPEKAADQIHDVLAALRDQAEASDDPLHDHARAMWQVRAEALLANRPEDDPSTDLHACRVALKKVRYSTELLRQIEGSDRDGFDHALIAMQDLLGGWNDHLYATSRLSATAGDSTILARDAGFAASVLTCATARARLADAQRREAVAKWPAFRTTVERQLETIHASARAAQPAS
jgi:CHAD domain-containing protein